MNAAADCHEIPGCPNLFIDAFRGRYLSSTSKDPSNVFVLTHYHGDHYGSLPREHKYQGPALIHCTPVTAALLRRVHQVPDHLVREHAYGQPWEVTIPGGTKNPNKEDGCRTAQVTFYDANHCPGAAMVLVRVPSSHQRTNDKGSSGSGSNETFVHHLHTGDFRYHPRMQTYPRLDEAVRNRTLDCLFLDTTFAHPRHSFVPQSVAIETIASQVHELLGSPSSETTPTMAASTSEEPTSAADGGTSTLVLLGCYSIGKERVLWEVATRTQQLVHVSEAKLRKLECAALHGEEPGARAWCDDDDDDENDAGPSAEASAAHSRPQEHRRIVDRCTTDPNQSDVHVVPMGLAGEMWPYFQPRYDNCYEYAARLDKPYRRVVAFLPTGWANGSKWNVEHSCSRQLHKGMEVEIRLVPYSEHSSFQELEQFVAYCRPRIVVPTVFADDRDRRRIQSLFPIDTRRAKRHFFSHSADVALAATTASATGTATGAATNPMRPAAAGENDASESPTLQKRERPASTKYRKRKAPPPPPPSVTVCDVDCDVNSVEQLVAMGFARRESRQALTECNGSVEGAVEWLLRNKAQRWNGSTKIRVEESEPLPTPEASSPSSEDALPRALKKQAQTTLLNYFARKT